MADPAWTDATRDDLHQDMGFPMGLTGFAFAAEFFFHPQNASRYLVVTTDENAEAHLSVWRITAGKLGLDTDVNGYCWCTYDDNTPSGGNATLNVYNDSARSVLVATGAAADGGTLTLTPQTGYTLAGTVKTTAAAADFNFRFRFMLQVPPVRRLEQLWDNTSIDDSQIRAAGKLCLDGMRSDFAAAKAKAQGFGAFVSNTKLRRLLSSLSDATALADDGLKRDTGETRGAVDWRPFGLLVDMKLAQAGNTGGSAEIKAGAGVFSGAPAYQSWTGRTTTAATYGQRTKAALVTGTCKKALSGTPPEFEMIRRTDDTRFMPGDGTQSETARFKLVLGQTWREPSWGIESILIDYAPTITNEGGGTAVGTTTTDWTVVGLKSTLSDGGKFWGIYNAGVFEFYSTEDARDARDSSYLVAQKTFASTTTAFSTETTTTGLVINGKSGGTLTSGHKFNVDFNAPTPNSPVSYFTITISETTRASSWVRRMRDGAIGGAEWVPNTGSAPNLQDGWIDAGLPLINASVQGDKV